MLESGTNRKRVVWSVVVALGLTFAGCDGTDGVDAGPGADAGPGSDAGPGPGVDAGPGPGVDAGPGLDAGPPETGLDLIGTSGNPIVINRLWIQGCVPGQGGATWTDVRRVLLTDAEPYRLATTMTDYQNGSATPDCENGRVGVTTFTQEVSSLGRQVPFAWVDAAGADAASPPGLEAVTQGNLLEGLMTEASVTAETSERADQLNGAMFCGVTTWVAGEAQDVLLCFNGGPPVPGRALLVIDDRVMPWKNYQSDVASAVDAEGNPTQVPNFTFFEGPFPTP